MHQAVRAVWKQILKRVVQLSCSACVVAIAAGAGDWVYGLLLGTGVGLLNFFLIGKRISETVNKRKSSKNILIGFFFRFVILSLAFCVAVRYDTVNIVSFAIGIFLVQIAIYIDFIWGFKQHE
ncbi:ATP synthase subunit I [bacterium]|nr:ATP synthase subunit I [bacterium]MCP5463036.1 ATP synthase subunit I [bacterium]